MRTLVQDSKQNQNRIVKTIETLRESYTPLVDRLTPDIEPATVYVLAPLPHLEREASEAQ